MTVKSASWFSFLCGLLALMLCWFFWVPFYGIIITFITLGLSVAAVVSGRKLKKQNKATEGLLDKISLRNAKYAVVMGWTGVFFSVACFVMAILFSLYYKFLTS